MKSLFFSSSFRAGISLLALTLGLAGSHPGNAYQLPQPSTPLAAGLRVIVTALPNSSVLRVRYESADDGAVHLRLRDAQGRVLYDNLKRQPRFAGDFDLAAYPAGRYTLELKTPGSRYVETLDLRKSSPIVATLVEHPVAQPVL